MFEILIRMQSSRLNDQRCLMPLTPITAFPFTETLDPDLPNHSPTKSGLTGQSAKSEIVDEIICLEIFCQKLNSR